MVLDAILAVWRGGTSRGRSQSGTHHLHSHSVGCPQQQESLRNCTLNVQWTGFPGGASGEEPACQCRRRKKCRFDPGSGRSPGGGQRNPAQYPSLEHPMDRGAWRVTAHRVTESDTTERLSAAWGVEKTETASRATLLQRFVHQILGCCVRV